MITLGIHLNVQVFAAGCGVFLKHQVQQNDILFVAL